MEVTENTNLGQFAAAYKEATEVFDAFEIDYYSLGRRTLGEACEQKKIKIRELIFALNKVLRDTKNPIPEFQTWTLIEILDYVDELHVQMRSQIQTLISQIESEKNIFETEVRVEKIRKGLEIFATQLNRHHRIEEEFTLPYFRDMGRAYKENSPLEKPFFGNLDEHIDIMLLEHEVIAKRFRWILNVARYDMQKEEFENNKFYKLLSELYPVVKRYIHIENNVVFPRVKDLQKKLSD